MRKCNRQYFYSFIQFNYFRKFSRPVVFLFFIIFFLFWITFLTTENYFLLRNPLKGMLLLSAWPVKKNFYDFMNLFSIQFCVNNVAILQGRAVKPAASCKKSSICKGFFFSLKVLKNLSFHY